ncbi:MAG TPA: class I SAM-dependent methyltransferase [Ktedonobacterales bacterium]|jgi:ubiquinone/menaquinone biosynthesis C-methylase UbiE
MKTQYVDYQKVPVAGRFRSCLEMAQAQDLPGKVIVDIGCSNGLVAHYLVAQNPKTYVGIDPSAAAIQQAQASVAGAEFYQASAEQIPAQDDTADIVLMFDVIEHVPAGTEIQALKEAYRIMKKGGVLLLSTPNAHPLTNLLDPAWFVGHRHYRPLQIERFVTHVGFELVSLEIRGGLWSSLHLLWFYVMKWVFRNPMPRSRFLEALDDKQFRKSGIYTIFAVCQK